MPAADAPESRDREPSEGDEALRVAGSGLAAGRPLRSAAFRWFLGGQSISMAGSAMSPVALAFGVLEATDSAAWLSAVTSAALVPMVAALLLGGGVADRYRRDTVLRLTSLGAGLTQAGVAFVLLTHQHPAFLLPLSALNGVFQGLTKPALRGIVANLATRGIQRASSLLASVYHLYDRDHYPALRHRLTTYAEPSRTPSTPTAPTSDPTTHSKVADQDLALVCGGPLRAREPGAWAGTTGGGFL